MLLRPDFRGIDHLSSKPACRDLARCRIALPQRIGNWSLTSLQQRLVKTAGRLVKHARYRVAG